MDIIEQIKYILFEINNSILFRLKYLLEKIIKMPFIFIKYRFSVNNIFIPYLFRNDYILSNIDGNFKIKSKSDFDYIFNPYFEKELRKNFKSKGIFLDIGSHAGKWSIFSAKQGNKVFAFEPNPNTFNYLLENINLNNLKQYITACNVGIGDKKRTMKFDGYSNETGKSKISETGNIEVQIITIDDFIKEKNINISEIDLIKVDTEGFEFNVFKGMSNFLKETTKINIICEILDDQTDKNEIFNFLESFGFKYKKLETPADYLFYKN